MEVPVSSYFKDVLLTINSLHLSDEDFFSTIQDPSETQHFTINGANFKSVNSLLEFLKIIYEYIKIIRFFKEISFEAS